MKLLEALKEVKDENLSQEKLESLRDTLVHIHTDIMLQVADLKKKRAFYMPEAEISEAERSRKWNMTDEGQKLIQYEHYVKIINKECDSLKSRIFSTLR